jgi:hypothetical protein
MKRLFLACFISATPALAQGSTPLDLDAVDPSLLEGFFGTWRVQNTDGSKTCDVKLTRDETIGGMAIEVADGCAAAFPVMGDVASWRLYENFEIVFADATRRELIRFFVPDNAYAATPEVDGIVTIIQPADEISPAP